MHSLPNPALKYEMALDGMHFLIACCQDDIARAERSGPSGAARLGELRSRLAELVAVDRRLRINTDSTTLRICEVYGAQVRARLALDAAGTAQAG